MRLLGTTEIAVIHHTECGMLTFTNPDLHAKVKKDLGADASHIDFLPFSDLESIPGYVSFLMSSPSSRVAGLADFLYECERAG